MRADGAEHLTGKVWVAAFLNFLCIKRQLLKRDFNIFGCCAPKLAVFINKFGGK